jgi:hypothetical protein
MPPGFVFDNYIIEEKHLETKEEAFLIHFLRQRAPFGGLFRTIQQL